MFTYCWSLLAEFWCSDFSVCTWKKKKKTHARTQRRLHRWTISTRPCSADTQGAVQLRNSIPGRKSSGAAGQPFEVPSRRPWYWREVWRRELILNDFGLYKGIAWSYSLVTISTHHYTYLCRFDFSFLRTMQERHSASWALLSQQASACDPHHQRGCIQNLLNPCSPTKGYPHVSAHAMLKLFSTVKKFQSSFYVIKLLVITYTEFILFPLGWSHCGAQCPAHGWPIRLFQRDLDSLNPCWSAWWCIQCLLDWQQQQRVEDVAQ